MFPPSSTLDAVAVGPHLAISRIRHWDSGGTWADKVICIYSHIPALCVWVFWFVGVARSPCQAFVPSHVGILCTGVTILHAHAPTLSSTQTLSNTHSRARTRAHKTKSTISATPTGRHQHWGTVGGINIDTTSLKFIC